MTTAIAFRADGALLYEDGIVVLPSGAAMPRRPVQSILARGGWEPVEEPLTAHLPGQHDQATHNPHEGGGTDTLVRSGPEFTSKPVMPGALSGELGKMNWEQVQAHGKSMDFIKTGGDQPGLAELNPWDVADRIHAKVEINQEITGRLVKEAAENPELRNSLSSIAEVHGTFKIPAAFGHGIDVRPWETVSDLGDRLSALSEDTQKAIAENYADSIGLGVYQYGQPAVMDRVASAVLHGTDTSEGIREKFMDRYVNPSDIDYTAIAGQYNAFEDEDGRPTPRGYYTDFLQSDELWKNEDFRVHLTAAVETRSLIDTWAQTASDSNIHSLSLQMAAAEVFGVDPSGIQGHLEEIGMAGQVEHRLQSQDGELLRSFAKAMYDDTQEKLAAAGIDNVVLFRGMNWPTPTPGLDYNPPLKTTPEWAQTEGVKTVNLNPMSSWAAWDQTAYEFGSNGVVLAAEFPASRIISTARTGNGCLSEFEYIVLGGPVDVYLTKNNPEYE